MAIVEVVEVVVPPCETPVIEPITAVMAIYKAAAIALHETAVSRSAAVEIAARKGAGTAVAREPTAAARAGA
jgi:hypothetical protein